MRTVLSGIRLFNDNSKVDAKGFYIKTKGREKKQDSGETKRECVWEAELCGKREVASAIKLTIKERIKCIGNMRLISKDNDVVPTICICSSVCLWMTFRSTDKSQISNRHKKARTFQYHKNVLYITFWWLSMIIDGATRSLENTNTDLILSKLFTIIILARVPCSESN